MDQEAIEMTKPWYMYAHHFQQGAVASDFHRHGPRRNILSRYVGKTLTRSATRPQGHTRYATSYYYGGITARSP